MSTHTLIVLNKKDDDRDNEFIQFEPQPDMAQTEDELGISFWRTSKAGTTKVTIPWTSILYAISE